MASARPIVLFAGLGGELNAAKWAYVQRLRADLADRGCQLHCYDLARKLKDPERDVYAFPREVDRHREDSGEGAKPSVDADGASLLGALDEAARWQAAKRGHDRATARAQMAAFVAQSMAILRQHEAGVCILWNQFTPQNHAVAAACAAAGVTVLYAHLGLLPGTVVFEADGQMAESWVAQEAPAFCALPVSQAQRERARRYLARAKAERWTRKPQGDAALVAEVLCPHVKAGRTVIFYAGQNDFASGMIPTDLPRARLHSPHFETTEAALRALAQAAKDRDWVILFKPHPSMTEAADDADAWKLDRVVTVPDANVFACIEAAAATVTILSQVAYLALIQDKPAVLLGRMQLSGMGCTYELDDPAKMGDTVAWAVAEAFTPAQREAFEAHVARLMLHYLSPLDEDTAKLLGKPLTDGAAVLAARADVAQGKVERGLPAIIDELMRGCTQHEKKYRHYLERTSWRVLADHGVLRQHAAGAKSVLDVGAVPPLLAALLRVDGMDAAVADPGADAFGPYCDARGIAWANADLLAGHDPFPGRQFDLVCFCEVLEHLTGDVLGALDRVIDKVTPGGLLYVTTPNLRSVSGLVALLWHGKGLASKWRETVRDQYARAAQGGGYYGHVREYTAGEVITLFENLGFEHLASAYQTHPRAETPGRKVIQNVEWMFPTWALYGKHVFRRKTNSERKEN